MIRDGIGYVTICNLMWTLEKSLPLANKYPESRWVNRRNCFINISYNLVVAYSYLWAWREE
jgi:hypothetical protein